MVKWIREYRIEVTGLVVMATFLITMVYGIDILEQWRNQTEGLSAWSADLRNLSTLFLSIFFEGIPFILMGVFVSGIIHVFTGGDVIGRLIPKNRILAVFPAAFLGLLLPVCECGVIPVARRLIQKGLPSYVAFTFLLAVPVINPITIFSTYIAFGNQWEMVVQRTLVAAIIAVVMGLLCSFFLKGNVLKDKESPSSCDCEDSRDHPHPAHTKGRLRHALYHSLFEFVDMGKYFVAGALLAASFQTFIGLAAIREFAQNEWLAVLVMMLLAFGMSLCSSADAFVAASFRTALSTPPLLAFLVFGPIMDLKNLLMMSAHFQTKVILFFVAGTTLLTLLSVGFFYLI